MAFRLIFPAILIAAAIALTATPLRADDAPPDAAAYPPALFKNPESNQAGFDKGGKIVVPKEMFESSNDSSKLGLYGILILSAFVVGGVVVLGFGLGNAGKSKKKRVQRIPQNTGEFSVGLRRAQKKQEHELEPRKTLAHRRYGKLR